MTEQQKLTFTALQQRLDSLTLRDRLRFSRRLHGVKKVKNPDAQQAIFQEMAKEMTRRQGKSCCAKRHDRKLLILTIYRLVRKNRTFSKRFVITRW
ncbi:RNA helicase [Escherichia coli]